MRMVKSSMGKVLNSLSDEFDPYCSKDGEGIDLSHCNGFIRLRDEDRPVLHLESGKRAFIHGLRFQIVRSSQKRTYLQCQFKELLFARVKDGPLWGAETWEFNEQASTWISECFPLTLAGRVAKNQSYWIAQDVWRDYKDALPERLAGYVANNPYWNELANAARRVESDREQRMKELRWKLLDAQLSSEDVFKKVDSLSRNPKGVDPSGKAVEDPVQKFRRLRSEFLSANRQAAASRDPLHPFHDTWFTAMYAAKAEALSIELESARTAAERHLAF